MGVFFWDLTLEHLEANQDDISGRYFFENVNSSKVMDVDGSRMTDSANVIQWSWSCTDNQKWNVILNSGGTYRLENVNSGKVLDTAGGAEGDSYVQNTWSGAASQKREIPQI